MCHTPTCTYRLSVYTDTYTFVYIYDDTEIYIYTREKNIRSLFTTGGNTCVSYQVSTGAQLFPTDCSFASLMKTMQIQDKLIKVFVFISTIHSWNSTTREEKISIISLCRCNSVFQVAFFLPLKGKILRTYFFFFYKLFGQSKSDFFFRCESIFL